MQNERGTPFLFHQKNDVTVISVLYFMLLIYIKALYVYKWKQNIPIHSNIVTAVSLNYLVWL